jgi:lysyl-tRNA synthetase class 2
LHRAGLQVLEFGDEAILHTDEFTLEGRSMRGVRQAVSRNSRAGVSVCCYRIADLDKETLQRVREKVDVWRDGLVERGFSMALGRLGADEDGRALLVLATDAEGQLVGLLHFVPWGSDGLSLDLMRRDREAENGIIEAMVSQLMAVAPSLGIRRVSLNFAVFRSVFARGERLGAGPALRIWRAVLMWASRFWQIESLYRANAKYQPEWVPRYLAYPNTSDVPRVATAALRAEAFLVAPAWLRRVGAP